MRVTVGNNPINEEQKQVFAEELGLASIQDVSQKQDVLQSGVNIKTVNGNDLLGQGNIEISVANVDGGTFN